MERVYEAKTDCSGCGACARLCPEGAIAMIADEEGFLYPHIQQEHCVDCGVCKLRCPLEKKGHFKEAGRARFYAARHRSREVLEQSTSGGAFTAVSDAVLRQGGVVYGADYDEAFHVIHKRAETASQRDRMRISKYVQSDLGETFVQVKADLQSGRKVLFTGTPCQAAGLRSFLQGSPELLNLYVCDLICHSIPSPYIWEAYKMLLEKENTGKLTHVQFRSKKDGWSRDNSNKGFLFSIDGETVRREDDRFYQLFFKVKTITRPSCSRCRFTDVQRPSDMTIADYWGIEKYRPDWFDSMGVSLVMVNSPQGAALLKQCREELLFEERPAAESLQEQQRLSRSGALPLARERFWEDFRQFGLEYVLKNYV
ncbi:Coenzyme F420 hydrogenase/dehydrogenase, beta subunit C-terminal domain [Anaeromusa acidaminophila]|uniref:Coenzyme F420 hydrogenase/dehydrogenase, beta subunit C-terminal domain n=1 Tax=Anaeromusa acidaminophila TaxID=81464 RepID=UPI0003675E2E|nr:Coenzyme F420 hydrogenase/dehydrogenase, beta subunit C-terminal domain [Anaeromusa acidaminophila]